MQGYFQQQWMVQQHVKEMDLPIVDSMLSNAQNDILIQPIIGTEIEEDVQ